MATVVPFRGMMYSARVPDLATVVAPPYDVIGPEAAVRLREADPHNIIHVDLPEGDPPEKYRHAARLLTRWVEEGVLSRQERPSICVIAQSSVSPGKEPRTRWGFMALLRIEDEGGGTVLPHENTMDAPRRDRAELTLATRVQSSPIFVLYSDPEGGISGLVERFEQRPPDHQFIDADGHDTRLWSVSETSVLRGICGGIEGHRIWIADGHHRYAAAREARDILRRESPAPPGSRSFDYVLASFSNIDSPGVVIRPYHRVTRDCAPAAAESLIEKVAGNFLVKRFSFEGQDHRTDQIRRRLREAVSGGRIAIAVYRGGGGFAILVLDTDRPSPLTADLPPPLRNLDVSVLHRIILPAIGISAEDSRQGTGLRFTADADHALDWVDGSPGQMAFLLHPPDRAKLMEVTAIGERMPQKSTYFHPKVPTGLVLNPLEPFDEVHRIDGPGAVGADR